MRRHGKITQKYDSHSSLMIKNQKIENGPETCAFFESKNGPLKHEIIRKWYPNYRQT